MLDIIPCLLMWFIIWWERYMMDKYSEKSREISVPFCIHKEFMPGDIDTSWWYDISIRYTREIEESLCFMKESYHEIARKSTMYDDTIYENLRNMVGIYLCECRHINYLLVLQTASALHDASVLHFASAEWVEQVPDAHDASFSVLHDDIERKIRK